MSCDRATHISALRGRGTTIGPRGRGTETHGGSREATQVVNDCG